MAGPATKGARVRLIHWKDVEARPRIAQLRGAGYRVEYGAFDRRLLQLLREKPPAAVIIDLSRAPSQGRDLGIHLRTDRRTRSIALVFAGGDPQKVAAIRDLLPDAIFTEWNRIRSALRRALSQPPSRPVVPASAFAGYAGTPLPRKLGIKRGTTVAIIRGPSDFAKTLGQLPAQVALRRGMRGRCDLAIWFPRTRRDLEQNVARVGVYAGDDGLWIAWPKRSSGMQSDLTQSVVREAGLAAGLVDYKICAIDATWSGLRFARRKPHGKKAT